MRFTHLAEFSKYAKYQPFKFYLLISVIACFLLLMHTARHSFATVLKRSGVNIGIISELMGHANLATTEIYLDGFEEKQVEQAMQHLV